MASAAMGVVGTVLLWLAHGLDLPVAVQVLGALLAGASACWLATEWEEYLATKGVRSALLVIGVCLAAAVALSVALRLLPTTPTAVVVALLPLACQLSLRPEPGTRFYASSVETASYGARQVIGLVLRDHSLRLIGLLACVSATQGVLLGFAVRRLPDLSAGAAGEIARSAAVQAGSGVTPVAAAFAAAVTCVLVCFTLAFLGRAALSQTLYVAVGLAAAGACAFSTATPAGVFAGIVLVGASTQLAYFSVWIEMVQSAYVRRLPMVGLFIMLQVGLVTGLLVGAVAGHLLPAAASAADPVGIGGASAASLALMVVAALLLASLSGRLTVSEELLAPPQGSGLQAGLLRLAASCGLTPRETQVLQIWVSGHNAAFIEEQLNISRNTVKSHLNHIYQKTKVGSREELLALLDK